MYLVAVATADRRLIGMFVWSSLAPSTASGFIAKEVAVNRVVNKVDWNEGEKFTDRVDERVM